MSAQPRVLFLADFGPEIGGGHVMRSLTLAGALAARGAACAFIAQPGVGEILTTYGDSRVQALPVDEVELEALAGRAARLAEDWRPDWLAIDHYRLGLDQEAAFRAPGRRLMAIDDLGRPHACDLLLDPGYGRAPDDYLGLVPAGARLLTGPRYALLRPAFAAAREKALSRRGGARVGRVLLSLGLTDVGAVTLRTVQALSSGLGEATLDVALSRSAPSLQALRPLEGPRLRLHVDAADMAGLATEADLALGAGGSSAWERACLGLPAVTLVLADNQRALARRMDADGLTLAAEAGAEDFEARLLRAFRRLADDAPLRAAMSARLAELCDGLGAARAAEAMLA